jgi:hypothetical protein
MAILKIGLLFIMPTMVCFNKEDIGIDNQFKLRMNRKKSKDIDICYYVK